VEVFFIIQIIFDAVLLFGILFLFHFSVNQTQKKKEESDILKDIRVQEIRENLQELLMTLKQLGKEVSDNIQEQVKAAETKTEVFKKAILRFQRDLTKVTKLSDELNTERIRLEEKADAIEASKKKLPRIAPPTPNSSEISDLEVKKNNSEFKKEGRNSSADFGFSGSGKNMGISPELVKAVYQLADLKMGINEIIHQTKLSRAEVQLILNLRGNRFAAPN
jgi:septal ring factor EnvC (AmiA/AmiB activator)